MPSGFYFLSWKLFVVILLYTYWKHYKYTSKKKQMKRKNIDLVFFFVFCINIIRCVFFHGGWIVVILITCLPLTDS